MCERNDSSGRPVVESRGLTLEEGLPVAELEQRIAAEYASYGRHHRAVAFYLADAELRGVHRRDDRRSMTPATR